MNGPVYEVQHIPRQLDPALSGALPLDSPEHHEPPASQALHLSATPGEGRAEPGRQAPASRAAANAAASSRAGCWRAAQAPTSPAPNVSIRPAALPPLPRAPDVLLGRGDNGMLWAFDLSERMGWADGSRPGTWLRGLPGGGRQAAEAGAGGGWEASEGSEDADMAEVSRWWEGSAVQGMPVE